MSFRFRLPSAYVPTIITIITPLSFLSRYELYFPLPPRLSQVSLGLAHIPFVLSHHFQGQGTETGIWHEAFAPAIKTVSTYATRVHTLFRSLSPLPRFRLELGDGPLEADDGACDAARCFAGAHPLLLHP